MLTAVKVSEWTVTVDRNEEQSHRHKKVEVKGSNNSGVEETASEGSPRRKRREEGGDKRKDKRPYLITLCRSKEQLR